MCACMIACWIVCAIRYLLLSYELLLLVWSIVRFNWLILESYSSYSLPKFKQVISSHASWLYIYVPIVLYLVTDKCFLQFRRDNQNQESRFQHWLLEGETDRRRSERNRQPDTGRRCGWWKTIHFICTYHLEVRWYAKEAELKKYLKATMMMRLVWPSPCRCPQEHCRCHFVNNVNK